MLHFSKGTVTEDLEISSVESVPPSIAAKSITSLPLLMSTATGLTTATRSTRLVLRFRSPARSLMEVNKSRLLTASVTMTLFEVQVESSENASISVRALLRLI